MIKIHDKHFKPYLSSADLDEIIENMAIKINEDYADKSPIFVGVLNGSFMFISDLMKKIDVTCELHFIKMQSYEGIESTGSVKKLIGLSREVEGCDLVILEDIVDTGNTIVEILSELNKLNASSIKIATLLHKPDVYDKNHTIDYIGIDIPDKFVVGFGLDYDGLGRNLTEIYQLAED